MANTHGLEVGSAVKLHPCTDEFMKGIKFAEITSIGKRWVYLYSSMHKHKFKMRASHLGVNIVYINQDWPERTPS